MFHRVARLARLVAVLVVVVAVPMAVSRAAGAEPAVVGVRIGEHPDKTRFVVDLTEPVTFSVFTLADPYRVVIDLPKVDWRADSGTGGRTGVIRGFRYGLFTSSKFRIVLDTKTPVVVSRSFLLPATGGNHHRLVLDLKSVDRAAFLKLVNRPPAPRAVPPPAPRAVPPPAVARATSGRKVVVIDPGHGGVDPGAIGVGGLREKTVTLAVGRELRRILLADGKYDVVMTRDRDIFLRLRNRVGAGRNAHGDLFISIHADSIKDRKVRGATVYTLSENSSDKEAEELARRENKADVLAGIDLNRESIDVASILIDLAQRESMNYSAEFANFLIPELAKTGTLRRNSHRFAGFRVLKAPDVPSVLVELGYLSNRQDSRRLGSDSGRRKLAQALNVAIGKYFTDRGR